MRAQRKEIRPELIMQFARDLLALDVLQRDGAFGQPPLLLDRLAQRHGKMVQPGADRGELRRAARARRARRRRPASILAHRLRERLQRRQRAADDHHRDQEERDRDRGADLELGDDPVPDLGDLVVRNRGDHERRRLAVDRDRHADGGFLGMNRARRTMQATEGASSLSSAGCAAAGSRRPEA